MKVFIITDSKIHWEVTVYLAFKNMGPAGDCVQDPLTAQFPLKLLLGMEEKKSYYLHRIMKELSHQQHATRYTVSFHYISSK